MQCVFRLLTVCALLASSLVALSAQDAKPLGQAVITTAPVQNWDEAKAKAVTEVNDGDPMYLCLQLPNAVSTYVARFSYDDQDRNSVRKVLRIEYGPQSRRMQVWTSDFFEPKGDELKSNFLCINLAPGEVRPLAVTSWLKIVGEGQPGVWKNQIWVWALGQEEDTYNDDNARQMLANVPITANVPKSIKKYKAQYDAFMKLVAAATNQAPAKGKLVDKASAKAIPALIANVVQEKVEGWYFTEDYWKDQYNNLGTAILFKYTPIIFFYKRDGHYFEAELLVRNTNGKLSVNRPAEYEIPQEEFAKGLKLAK